MEIVRLTESRLAVRIRVAPPFIVSEFAGAADETGHATLCEWTERMVEEPEPVVVLEMGSLEELSGAAASTLTRGLREAQRLEKGVRLVRCRRADFDRLQAAGLRGEVWHCGSLAQATDGTLGGSETSTRLHFRADRAALLRVGVMLDSLTRQLQLPTEIAESVRASALEAAANAVTHGSPGGARDTVTLIIHRLSGQLVIEVQDCGHGFEGKEAGEGVTLMQRLVDELEFLPNPSGLLTRLSFWLPARWEHA
jgi:anti-sigma regulatory factor (Ser/Thr protein kinase)